MLNFRNTNIVFGLAAMLLLWLSIKGPVPWYGWFICLLVYVGLLFYGSVFMSAEFYVKARCKGPANQKNIALTFDDGPHEKTEAILEILQRYQVSAGFFIIGQNIPGRENVVKKIYEQGHIIGNHSDSHHFWFDIWTEKTMMADLQAMNARVEQLIGRKPVLFRPPYGVTTPRMKGVMEAGGFTAIGWSIRSFDTIISDNNKLLDKLSRALHPGAIVLMHDHGPATIGALPRFIEAAKDNGYTFVRPDELLNIPAYA